MVRLLAMGLGLLLSSSFGCYVPLDVPLAYVAVKDAERNEARNRVHQQRLAEKNRRIRDEAPQCWDPITEWRDEMRDTERRQALWVALPAECKAQVRQQ